MATSRPLSGQYRTYKKVQQSEHSFFWGVGTEYMSKEKNRSFKSKGISSNALIRQTEFFTLNVYGSRTSNWSCLESNLANLYAGAFCQLKMGLMGNSILCILGKPLMERGG